MAGPRSLFTRFNEGTCEPYRRCRKYYPQRRAQLEAAWAKYGHLCPEGARFVDEFRKDFEARSWELYLMAALSEAGLTLQAAPKKGPDILVQLPKHRCWIECVVPRPGDGEDKVFQRPPGDYSGPLYSEDALLLRYTSTLRDKLKKIHEYIAAGIVQPADRVLVAINQGAILDSEMHDPDVPLMVKAVYPIGEPVVVLVPYDKRKSRVEVPARAHVVKKKKTTEGEAVQVPTTLFLEPAASVLSGVLFSRFSVRELEWNPRESLHLLHNRDSSVPIKRATLPVRCEMWFTPGGKLMHKGRCAQWGRYAR